MPQAFHATIYRRLKTLFQGLTFGLSLGFRIYLSTFVILFTTSAAFVLLYSLQNRQSQIVEDIMNRRISSLESARKIKEAIVTYDNVIFRYIATNSDSELRQAKELRKEALLELNRLNILAQNSVIESRLIQLRGRLQDYFSESTELVEHARLGQPPETDNLFKAAAWARREEVRGQQLQELSSEGSYRLHRVFALCDELLTYNNAMLALSRAEINDLRTQGRLWSQVIFYIATGIVILVSMILAITLIGPIRMLMGGVTQMERGRFNIELPVTTSTEIGRLIQAFNRMAKTIHVQQERLITESITDNLTGVYNQRYLTRRLREEFDRTRRNAERLSLMMIDVDFFKKYNDRFGHELGNVVLKKIANVIKENLRSVDLLFRYGGDEFAAILPNADEVESKAIAQRLTEVIRKVKFPGLETDPSLRISLSVGGATFPETAKSLDDLVEHADAMLYAAKAEGRDCFRWFCGDALVGMTRPSDTREAFHES